MSVSQTVDSETRMNLKTHLKCNYEIPSNRRLGPS